METTTRVIQMRYCSCGRFLTKVLGRDFCLGCDRPQTYEEQLSLMERRVITDRRIG